MVEHSKLNISLDIGRVRSDDDEAAGISYDPKTGAY